MADVNGTWLGTYWQSGEPTRFEATLAQHGSALSGNILDDCYLGEATISGEVIGRSIAFTKQYLTTSPQPVSYTGTISEDGDTMRGQWRLTGSSGPWEAHRGVQDLMADLKAVLADKVPAMPTK
ncbi:hypothetical protein [Anthocerotibacter panamensis]|uniref:hypothetical protein n=1 Tax=Anthocerotibacter panamensis TaxID=2857077 RepID=UPI001C40373C|nr:hypothetical protein [Anthocerotibacter panamensis]